MRRGFFREHHWVAACIYADTSSFSRERFYLDAFALPLFIPTDHLYFNYGFRIGTHWDELTDETIDAVAAALPRLESLTTWAGLVAAARSWTVNLRAAELRLCIGILAPEETALAPVREAIEQWRVSRGWEHEVLERRRPQVLELLR
jgi:hypothetical protein